MKTAFPDAKPGRQANFAAQVNQFVNTMAVGDIVVSPLKTLSKIGIGEITGPYQQLENGYPARPVKWLTTDVLRDVFKQDLLYSFGAIMTVCKVRRNDALKRVLAVAKGGKDPGDGNPSMAWHFEDLRFGILDRRPSVFFCLCPSSFDSKRWLNPSRADGSRRTKPESS